MFKSIGSNWTYNFLYAIASLYLMRFVIGTVGTDVNGGWQCIVNATGYLTLLLLGVPMASVRYFSQALAKKDFAELNRMIGTCFVAYLVLGAAAVVGSGIFFAGFEAWTIPKVVDYVGKAGLSVEHGARDARIGFALMTLYIAGGFASQVPYAILAAYREFPRRNIVMTAVLVVRVVATVLLLGPGTAAFVRLAAVQVLTGAFEFCAAAWLVKRLHPEVKLVPRGFEGGLMREILGFSVWALLLNVGNKLSFATDALVITWAKDLPLDANTTFETAKSFVIPLTDVVISIGAVVMPTVVKLKFEGKLADLDAVFLKWSKLALGICLLPGVYLCWFGGDFLREFVAKSDFAWVDSGRVQLIFLLAHFAFWPVRGVAMPILTALGKPKKATIAFLVSGIVNLGLSVWWVRTHGIDGVAWGTFVPTVAFSIYLLLEATKETGVGAKAWLSYVAPKCILGAGLVSAVAWALRAWWGPRTMFQLVVAGVLYSVAFGLVWVFFVHRGDRYADLLAAAKARFGRGRKP